MEQLARAELTSNKTVLVGEDSRYDRQHTRHLEVEALGEKIAELTNELHRCQSAQVVSSPPTDKLLIKYERAKHELSNLKAQLRTERK